MFAMVCGYLPFEDPNTSKLYKKILSASYHIPSFISTDCKDLMKRILNTDPDKRYTVDEVRNHSWYKLSKTNELEGIIVGVNSIQVDEEIASKLEGFGFNLEYGKKCVEANKHNQVTSTYYLLLKKMLKEGGKSVADIANKENKVKLI